MAVDTRDKRAAALGCYTPQISLFPNPDGSITGLLDRMQIADLYRGAAPASVEYIRVSTATIGAPKATATITV